MKEKSMIKSVSQRKTAPRWYCQFHISDYMTLLHIPFSVIFMAYVVIGATMAPELNIKRLVLAMVAVFCGIQGSHFLDELKGHPWSTKISNRILYTIGFLFISAGAGIGIYLSLTVSLLLIPFIVAMIFFPIAYSLELWEEKFHTPFWLGISGGFLVCFGSYFLQEQMITVPALLMSVAAGIHIKNTLILYEGTKSEKTRDFSWTLLRGNVVVWIFLALAWFVMKLYTHSN